MGFPRLTSREWNEVDEDGWGSVPNGRLAIVEVDGRTVAQATFPAGWADGFAPVNAWRTLSPAPSDLYIRFDIKRSANWIRHPVADKILYVDDHSFGGGGDPFTLIIAGDLLEVVRQGPLGTQHYASNRAAVRLEPGRWWTIEVHVVSHATAGQAHVWVNGAKTHEILDIPWSDSSPSWDEIKWEPVYGGYAEGQLWDLTQTQHMYLDNLYVSGR